jgi:RNA polymerase sigma-70 factor (ECF subfamily)
MPDTPEDLALDIRLLRAGVREGPAKRELDREITGLFDQWRGALLRYLSTFGLSPHDSEEVIQEVFLSLVSHLQKDKARTNLRGWLFRVAHNLGLKRREAGKRLAGIEADIESLPHPAMNPEEELATSERQRRLASVLGALPAQDRRCLYLRAEGLRYREIAEVAGISLGSVAASLARSLARFQRAEQR